jgi:hypothetical protein
MKKLLGILAVVALLAVPVMVMAGTQVNDQQYSLPVTVTVEKNVSMWAGQQSVGLSLNGGPANADAKDGTLDYISNVSANISVKVTGTLDPNVNFFIFPTPNLSTLTTAAAIKAELNSGGGTLPHLGGAASPTGALIWNTTVLAGANPAQTFGATVPVSKSISVLPVIYAADAPNALPDPQATVLTVLWTIAPAV